MTYADNYYLRNVAANMGLVANAIDGLLVGYSHDSTSGAISTTSGSYVDYTNLSLAITTASGQSLLILATILVSHSVDQAKITATIDLDGSNIRESYWRGTGTNTTGLDDQMTWWAWVPAPSVGAHTIKVEWQTSTGTAYSENGSLIAFALRTS